jgi:WhiB family redox-sensing transcriptional regulator
MTDTFFEHDDLQDFESTLWRLDAACRGLDATIFFPSPKDMATFKHAMSVCEECPVKHDCLEANLLEPDGIWGGTSAKERQRIRKDREIATSCYQCGSSFVRENPSQHMCSDECRTLARRAARNRYQNKNR